MMMSDRLMIPPLAFSWSFCFCFSSSSYYTVSCEHRSNFVVGTASSSTKSLHTLNKRGGLQSRKQRKNKEACFCFHGKQTCADMDKTYVVCVPVGTAVAHGISRGPCGLKQSVTVIYFPTYSFILPTLKTPCARWQRRTRGSAWRMQSKGRVTAFIAHFACRALAKSTRVFLLFLNSHAFNGSNKAWVAMEGCKAVVLE